MGSGPKGSPSMQEPFYEEIKVPGLTKKRRLQKLH